MKKILILAASAALVLAASCTKNEVVSTVNDEQHAIGFSNYAPRSITRAGTSYIDATVLPNGSQFVVYGYANTAATWASTLAPAFMNGVTVTFSGTDSSEATQDYSPVRYWPAGDAANLDWLSFYGYYPASGAGIAPTVTTGLGSYVFTAQDNAKDMIDFMVTDLAKDYVYGTAAGTDPNVAVDGVVPLTFHHALTKVQFVFQTDNTDANTTITINSATLKNIVKKGTLTVQETFATATNNTSPWAPSTEAADKGDYTVTINKATADVDLTNATAGTPVTPKPMTVDNEDIFLMVPQEVTTGKNLVIVWTVTTSGVATQNTSTIDLSDINISVGGESSNLWKANKSVIYTITVGLKPIKFTGSVTAWDTNTNAAISVN